MAIGGLLLENFGAVNIIIFDGVTSLVAVYFLFLLNVPNTKSKMSENYFSQLKMGFTEIHNKKVLKKTVVISSLRKAMYGIGNIIFTLYIFDVLMLTERWLGYSYAIGGLGAIIAGSILKSLMKNKKKIKESYLLILILLNIFMFILMFNSISIFAFIFFVFIHDFLATIVEIGFSNSILLESEKDKVGRVSVLFRACKQMFFLIRISLYTFVFNEVSYSTLTIYTSFLVAILILISWFAIGKESDID